MALVRPQHVTRELLNKVTKALGITALDQWYYISHQVASKAIGTRVLNAFGSVASFLKYAYPQHEFDEEKLESRSKIEKEQKFMEVVIRQLFPNEEIITSRKAVGMKNPEAGSNIELDFWLPRLKLGIEYQDKHQHDALEKNQKHNAIKKATMLDMGYTLISIGYWWDKDIESVAATIRKFRPDLLQNYEDTSAEPVPLEPPGYIPSLPVIPGVAGLMSAFVPNSYFDPTNWYASEKYDGIRGVYNPKFNKIFSRRGSELSVLPSLLKDIPFILVEGEITAGRGNYTQTTAISFHTQQEKVNWQMFRYVLFDVPDAKLGNYSQRYTAIASGLKARAYIFAQIAPAMLLVSKHHLKMFLDSIINDAGEGVIAQQDARYEIGRVQSIAKIKLHRDADAQVLHVNKFSCTCKLAGGATVDIIYTAEFDPSKLKIGNIVSYYHKGYLQSGKPRDAEIYKIRYDINWKDVISDRSQSFAKPRSIKEAIGGISLIPNNTTGQHKKGYWNKDEHVRAYFDEFARKARFNPLVPRNWYKVKISSLRAAGGTGVLAAHKHNMKKALSRAYPELKFGEEHFVTHAIKGRWTNPENVRAYFDEFAIASGFDPLVAENWHTIKPSTLQMAKGSGVLLAFKHDLTKALSFAYPELKFGEASHI